MAGSKRLSAKILDSDLAAIQAIEDIPEYAPRNAAYTLPELQRRVALFSAAERAERLAWQAYVRARAEAIELGHELHEASIGLKLEAVAQFGKDSYVIEALGLKRQSEYRRPSRRLVEK
jgi:hypothetical protein